MIYLFLVTVGIYLLREISAPVKKADADDRQAHIGGTF